jgi:Asp-tRNA(Asn)/Glu-tRNA(Gln) amidotransferase A subunit family amidase
VDRTFSQPAVDAAGMLRRREVSSRELTEMLLARIDAVNPALNAVVEVRREEALRQAAAADEAIARGGHLGPLHGVPMTIKDSFNVAGLHTTWGNPAFKDFVPDWDATVVERLERAGAIIAGKTNVAFMLADFAQTANDPVSGDVGAVMSDAVDALARAGALVVEGWPEGLDPALSSESFGFHVQLFFAFQQPGAEVPALSQVIEHENQRMAARAAWQRYFRETDVFLCPVNFTAAFPHDARPFGQRSIKTPEGERPYDSQPFWTAHAALPGLPAVAAPVGRTADGLPVGAQLLGPLYEDDTPITFAELLGDVVGGYDPPPI